MASLYAAHHSADGKRRGSLLGAFGPDVMGRRPYPSSPVLQECPSPRSPPAHSAPASVVTAQDAVGFAAASRADGDRRVTLGMARAGAGGDTWRWMARRTTRAVGPTVHERGNKRLDGVLDFVAFAARPMPLLTLLDEAPRRIVALLETEVCSLYLLEGDKSELVMRGNVGLSNAAIGQVRLRVGEGITGEAIEYMRPISTETAEQHGAYKHFAGIGEERFPVFLAVPIRGKAGPLGAVVVQRSTVPFTDADIEVLALIGGLIAAGSRHAELVDEARERRARRTGGGTRKVTLAGGPVVVGRALGAVAALRRPPRRPSERPPGPAARDTSAEVRKLRGAFDVAEKAIHGLRERAR